MKTVILAGGLGTRLTEETHLKPKPMIEIGNMPVIWHIMKIFSTYGINEFVICCGYKGHVIKEYFSNYFLNMSDVTFDMKNNKMEIHRELIEPWKVTLVNTGFNTMTGGRLKKVKNYIEDGTFCLTYGDDLKSVNISDLIKFHIERKKLATVTVTKRPGRFGVVQVDNEKVQSIKEKLSGDGNWINGGYYVLEPDVLDYIEGDSTVWEHKPLERLAKENQLSAYHYLGKYTPLDNFPEKKHLEELWNSNKAYWKIWD